MQRLRAARWRRLIKLHLFRDFDFFLLVSFDAVIFQFSLFYLCLDMVVFILRFRFFKYPFCFHVRRHGNT